MTSTPDPRADFVIADTQIRSSDYSSGTHSPVSPDAPERAGETAPEREVASEEATALTIEPLTTPLRVRFVGEAGVR